MLATISFLSLHIELFPEKIGYHIRFLHNLKNDKIGKLPLFSVLIFVFSCFQCWVS